MSGIGQNASAAPRRRPVVVAGGGLAGMACATALAERGRGMLEVVLLEARHALGGRAGSFEDQESRNGDGTEGAELLDNCQHVLLGCCTNLLDLYRRMGVSAKVAFHRRVHFLDERGGRHDLWALGTKHAGAPAPLHLGPAMAFFSMLGVRERAAVVRAMLAMMRLGRRGRERLEGMAFGQWLDQHGQPASLVEKFYDPILISALNEETRRASAKYAIQVFQEAMLANSRGYVVGLPACPLGELYRQLPSGVELRLSARVEDILFSGKRAAGVRLRGGEELAADAVVLATNYHAVQRWVSGLPGDLLAADGRFAGLDKLESVPILGVHMWFDRPVMTEPSVALIKGPLQWLFRKDSDGKQLHGVISAARAWVNVPKDEALRQFEAQVRSLFAAAREAKLLRGVIVIEKRATFSPLPGTDAYRPGQTPPAGGVENLYLAGDYTKTGWPATMEGAVRSGYLAAEKVLEALEMSDSQHRILVEDLPIQWPARLMGLSRAN